MKTGLETPSPRRCGLALVVMLPALGFGAQPAAAPPSEALAACASMADAAARLACYDKLAGRGGAAPATSPQAPAPTQRPAEQAPPPAAAATAAPGPAPAPAPAPAATSVPGSTTAAAAAAAPAPSTPQSFGSYEAEHPKPPPVSRTLEAQVVALGKSAAGRPTVTLEGGAQWELLDDADPLLAVGDTVTVTRAALGSYLMSTPTKRIHRVHRLD